MAENSDEKHCKCRQGVTRRGFLTSMGVGALAVGASGMLETPSAEAARTVAADEMTRLDLNVNGSRCSLLVEPRWTLLYVLREQLGLTGTKVGCERGECARLHCDLQR